MYQTYVEKRGLQGACKWCLARFKSALQLPNSGCIWEGGGAFVSPYVGLSTSPLVFPYPKFARRSCYGNLSLFLSILGSTSGPRVHVRYIICIPPCALQNYAPVIVGQRELLNHSLYVSFYQCTPLICNGSHCIHVGPRSTYFRAVLCTCIQRELLQCTPFIEQVTS